MVKLLMQVCTRLNIWLTQLLNMVRVLFNKSVATLTASYGKGAVAWLDESEAASFEKVGIVTYYREPEEPKIIVQNIASENVVTKKQRKTK